MTPSPRSERKTAKELAEIIVSRGEKASVQIGSRDFMIGFITEALTQYAEERVYEWKTGVLRSEVFAEVRNAALEEAAKIAEDYCQESNRLPVTFRQCQEIAKTIRALKSNS